MTLSRWLTRFSTLGFLACCLTPASLQAAAPVITNQPASQTIFVNDPVTFRVGAGGTAPLSFQWYRNGNALGSATTSTFTIGSTSLGDNGAAFSVIVTNTSGAATSAPAVLTIDLGVLGSAAVTNRFLSYTNVWKFSQTNNLDGVNWTATNYNDVAWAAGPGLLAFENNTDITPLIHTTLLDTRIAVGTVKSGHADYFRASVTITGNVVAVPVTATFRCDDGAVVYINGTEVQRIRMPQGTITNGCLATAFPPDPTGGSDAVTDENFYDFAGVELVPGTNVIAASVHQQNTNSSDIVWGLALDVAVYPRLRDTNPPVVVELLPGPGTVASFTQLEVHFSEGVKNLQATNLLVNGLPATNVTGYAPDDYVFAFPSPAVGPVQVTWSATQNIIDLSANSNRFAGGTYSYTLDPSAITANVRINEFMAGNTAAIADEDGHFSDWLELFNSGDSSVDLSHWYLTDNASKLTKWQIPPGVTLLSKTYLLIWASGNDRTNPPAPLHTNFKLDKAPGNFLGLVYTNGTTVVSAFANYPQQYDDVSYGRDRLDPSLIGYFTNATPGAANATLGANFAPPVNFSRVSGTFQQAFSLALSTDSTNAFIRYFLVTNGVSAALSNVPNASSTLYTGPIPITNTVQVRARAYSTLANYWPGPPASQTYIQIASSAAAFSSAAPIVLLCDFAAGKPSATADQPGVMMVFGNAFGRASMSNPPDLVARVGFNIRGRSTQNNPQSSYAIETWDEFNGSQNLEVLGLPAESDWVFYAPDNFDKPLIHNSFMHELSRRIGRYSSHVRMFELFTNYNGGAITYSSPNIGNYYGAYVLEEKIKADPGRVDIPKLKPGETNLPAISGGYIMKNDSANSGERILNAANQSMIYVEPKMDDYAVYPGRAVQEAYFGGYFNSFYAALTGPNWTHPNLGYAAWIDVDSWVDHHILEVLSRNADSLRLSAYYFKDRNQKISMGPLWDFDRSMGTSDGGDWRPWNPRSWMGSDPLGSSTSTDYGTDYFNPAGVFANPWFGMLFYDPNFWQKWIDRWQSLRQGPFSTNSLFAIVNLFADQAREAQTREVIRWAGSGASDVTPRSGLVSVPAGWPDTSYVHVFPGTYQGEIDFMEQWLADRLNFIDTNFLAQPVLSSSGGAITSGFPVTVSAPGAEPGTTTCCTLDGSDPRLPGGDISPNALMGPAPFNLIITTNSRVVARNWNGAHQNCTGPNNPPISSPWSGPVAATFVVATPTLAVTEIMYHPLPSGTNDDDAFEFIELKNVGAQTINLVGARFTNGISFTFTATNPITSLGAGQYLVLVKNLAAFQSRYPTVTNIAGQYPTSLNNAGEHIYLEGPMAEPILDFAYNDSWYPTTDGAGFSLVIRNENAPFYTRSNAASWRASSALYGSPGRADPASANIPAVVINEALTHTDPPQADTIELYNPTASPAPIGGWFLTDDPDQPAKYCLPTNTIIASGGYLLFDESQFNTGSNAFNLSSLGESVYLFSGDGTNLTGYRHGFDFGAQHNGVTFGRYVTSDGVEHFVTQKAASLGTANAGPKVGPVVLNEIMYSPPVLGLDTDTLDEYIELRNFSGQTVPLYDPLHATNAWRLDGGVQFTFPLSVTMDPWSYLLVVSFDPVADPVSLNRFTNHYNLDPSVRLFGPWQGHLENNGERVGLYEPDKPQVPPDFNAGFVPYVLVEEAHYSPLPPWPAGTDATGNSLQRVAGVTYADDPVNWVAATPSPGRINPASLTVDSDHDGLPDEWEVANGLNPLDATGINGALGDPDGDGMNNLQEYLAGTNPLNSSDYLHFDSVTISGAYCLLQFTPRAGRTYTIESTSALAPTSSWSATQTGLSGTNQISFWDPLTSGPRFYRLKTSFP